MVNRDESELERWRIWLQGEVSLSRVDKERVACVAIEVFPHRLVFLESTSGEFGVFGGVVEVTVGLRVIQTGERTSARVFGAVFIAAL